MQSPWTHAGACPNCHRPAVAQAPFCAWCGISFPGVPSAGVPSWNNPARKVCVACGFFGFPDAHFCMRCGARMPVHAVVPAHGEPAGFWIRALASFIDVAIMLIVVGLIFFATDFQWQQLLRDLDQASTGSMENRLGLATLPTALVTLGGWIYSSLMVGTFGGTLGMLVCGIRVVRVDGSKVSYGLAFLRQVVFDVISAMCTLSIFWVGISKSKRGLHDYACDTRVVYTR